MTIFEKMAKVTAALVVTLSIASTAIAKDPSVSIEMVNGELLMTDCQTGQKFTFFRLDQNPGDVRLADEGGSDRGGGDARIIWREVLKINSAQRFSVGVLAYALTFWFSDETNNYRNRMASLVSGFDTTHIIDEKVRAIFIDIRARGLANDIRQTRVVLQNRCVIQGPSGQLIERSATAVNGKPQTDICVDPVLFASRMDGLAFGSVIVGLMMHEYARHFGYMDEDHSFAVNMAIAFESMLKKENSLRPPQHEPILTLVAKSVDSDWKRNSDWAKTWKACIRNRSCF